MSVTFVQLATPSIDEYAVYSVASASQYCQKHGYGHIVLRSQLLEDLHINWTKIELLSWALDQSESSWIVLLDADTVIAQTETSIMQLIARYASPETHILMPRDTYRAFGKRRKRRPPRKIRPNAGLILLRNSAIAKQIILAWLEAARGDGLIYRDMHPRNQLVYWNFVMPHFLRFQNIMPAYVVNNGKNIFQVFRRKPFLYHVMKSSNELRSKIMKALFEKYGSVKTLQKVQSILKDKPTGFIELSKSPDV